MKISLTNYRGTFTIDGKCCKCGSPDVVLGISHWEEQDDCTLWLSKVCDTCKHVSDVYEEDELNDK